MTGQSPWSVKGVRPRTREAAKDLARREGLTLGEWLNRLIGEDEAETGLRGQTGAPAVWPGAPAYAAGYQQGGPQPAWAPPQGAVLQPFPVGSGVPSAQPAEAHRLTTALETLANKLETAGLASQPHNPPSAQERPAVSHAAIERALDSLGERLEGSESRTQTALGRFEANLGELRQTQTMLGERLRRMEADDPNHKSLAALRSLESAIARLAAQVQEGETRLDGLAHKLEGGMGEIAARLDRNRRELQGEIEARSEAGAAETLERLSRIEGQVTGFAERVGETARTALDRVEAAGAQTSQSIEGIEAAVKDLAERAKTAEAATHKSLTGLDANMAALLGRVEAAEAAVTETNARFAEAMIDLSARLTGVEGMDPREAMRSLAAEVEARLSQSQADMAEGMIDLSARLTSVESVDPHAATRALAGQFEARLSEVEQRNAEALAGARAELGREIEAALGSGIDSRFAAVAQALAERLDATEQRSALALEKVGGQVAKAASSLDQRLRQIEDREAKGKDAATAMRMELAHISRAIDERLNGIEQRDASAVEQAGNHMQRIAEKLTARIEQSEARATTVSDTVSAQMAQLAERLQARQDEANRHLSSDLARRIDETDERAARRLDERMTAVTREIQMAEDRAKAVSAPLHRGFTALVDRLDQVETRASAPFSETLETPSVTIASAPSSGFGVASFGAPSWRDEEAIDPAPLALDPATAAFVDDPVRASTRPSSSEQARRPGGFGSPFPGDAALTDTSGLSKARSSDPMMPLALDLDDPFSADAALPPPPFDRAPAAKGMGDAGHWDDADTGTGDLDSDWDDHRAPAAAGSNRQGFLENARRAAIEAASAREQASNSGRKGKSTRQAKAGKAGKGAAMVDEPLISPSGRANREIVQGAKAKGGLSPIGVAAAAALVVTGGALGLNAMRSNSAAEAEKPTVLREAAPAPAPVSDQGLRVEGPVAPAVAPVAPVPTAAPVGGEVPASAPTQAVPAAVPPAGASQSPTSEGVPSKEAAPAPRPSAQASPEMRRLAEAERARAAQARKRADEAQAQLARRAPAPAPAPAKAAAPPVSAAKTATPVPVPPRIATTPQAAPPARPAAAAKAAAPVAKAPSAGGSAAIYAQALQRQQAGDASGAARLMKQAADAGDARAANRLAKMYERGEGVPRDLAQARRLTEQAAQRGNRQAMHNLGVYYAEGEGAQQDFGRAAENFRRAARKGVTDSQFNLGAMAEQGLGTPKSDREALYWYSVAGRGGDRDAATKAREVGARLSAEERTAEEARAAAFQAEAGGED